MLIRSNHSDFDRDLLENLKFDPVHPATAWNERRTSIEDREIYFQIEDNYPTYVLCVAFTATLPDTMDQIFYSTPASDNHKFAIFYSVFKTPHIESPKRGSGWLILSAAAYIKEAFPTVEHFMTMSPIPSLTKVFDEKPSNDEVNKYLQSRKDPVSRFHLRNGASFFRVVRNADTSDIRQAQSWGIMANYDYTSLVGTL